MRSEIYSQQHIPVFGDKLAGYPAFIQNLIAFCLYETAFYVAYRYGMTFSHATASPFWFPDSVLLCALLLVRPRWWWVIVLAPLPIRLTVEVPPDIPLWFLLVTFVIDSAKGMVLATLLRRFLINPIRFDSVRELTLFYLIAVLLIPVISAFLGAQARSLLGFDYWSDWERWFLGDALAQLIVTPVIFYWILGVQWRLPTQLSSRVVEAGCLVLGLIMAGYMAFFEPSNSAALTESRFYAPIPFLIWAALRFGMRGASGAIFVTAVIAIGAASQGFGPFRGQSPTDTAIALQHFLLLRAAPLFFVAVLIEQKRGMERALRESEKRFRHMADTAPVMIWMSGADKRCEFVNKAWIEFTGLSLEQHRGRSWVEGIYPEDRRHCHDICNSSFEARRPFEIEYRLRRHDGQYRWILEQGVPRYEGDGDFIGFVGSAIDITDRKRAEEANQNIAHVSRLAVVGELTAMVAHEINQPLGAILSNAEAAEILLESENPPLEEIREILSDIRKNDLRADEAIRKIRTLLRKHELQLQPLDLNETVEDVLRLIAGDAIRRRIRLQPDLSPGLPWAFGDRIYLQQVLLNLIINAMDAMTDTPEEARRIIVRTCMVGDDVEVAVDDRGHGINAGKLSSIFNSFYTTKAEGMGLGLSIASSIIEMHDGRIWAANNQAGGATFHFSVPVAKERPQDTSTAKNLNKQYRSKQRTGVREVTTV